jgi:drug/metabolite transporter (DMT)-like permease
MYMSYIYIGLILFLTVYGQLILKWRMEKFQAIPENLLEKLIFSAGLLLDPFIFSSFVAAFLASLLWLIVLTKLELTRAYPFMSLAPSLVFVFGILLLGEQFSWGKIIGLLIIMLGIYVSAKY